MAKKAKEKKGSAVKQARAEEAQQFGKIIVRPSLTRASRARANTDAAGVTSSSVK